MSPYSFKKVDVFQTVLHPEAADIVGLAQGVRFSLGIEMLEILFLNKIHNLTTLPMIQTFSSNLRLLPTKLSLLF